MRVFQTSKRSLVLSFGLSVLTACSPAPELSGNISDAAKRASYPDLVPVEELQSNLTAPQIVPETRDSLDARVATLRARAAQLKRTVIDRNARNRLEQKPAVTEPS